MIIISLFIIVLILLVWTFDPFIDSYTDNRGLHIIIWYSFNGERKFIILIGG